MATSNVNVPSFAEDNVAVYDSDLNIVFQEARIVKDRVKELSRSMEHPLETGDIRADHKIILPIEIDLDVIIQSENYRNTYNQIKKLYIDSSLLSVQTRTTVYNNMYITDIPYEEKPEMFDAITMVIKVKEAQFENLIDNGYNPESETDQKTTKSGFKQTDDVVNTSEFLKAARKVPNSSVAEDADFSKPSKLTDDEKIANIARKLNQ